MFLLVRRTEKVSVATMTKGRPFLYVLQFDMVSEMGQHLFQRKKTN